LSTARFANGWSLSLVTIALVGCVETGDFGRSKASLWNDLVLPTTGSLAARLRGEPVSSFIYTDDEKELRDRAWRFLMPAHERSWFTSIVANLTRDRVLPPALHPNSRTAYHRILMSGRFRSPASRYRRLSEDASADLKLIAPFAIAASRVLAADDVRLRSLAYIKDLSPVDADEARARVAENRCLLAWVRYETHARLESYGYALEHLLIEAPLGEAVEAERTLAELAVHRQTLDALAPPLPEAILCSGTAELGVGMHGIRDGAAVVPEGQPIVVDD
jgi:hypothetical protein